MGEWNSREETQYQVSRQDALAQAVAAFAAPAWANQGHNDRGAASVALVQRNDALLNSKFNQTG